VHALLITLLVLIGAWEWAGFILTAALLFAGVHPGVASAIGARSSSG